MPVGQDVVNDTGESDIETTETTDSTDPRQAQDDIDSWANEKEPAKETRERAPDGKFTRGANDSRQVADALKQTIKQGTRPPQPEEDEEPDEEETEEREEKPRQRRQVKGIVNGREELIDLDDESFQKLNAVQASRAAQKAFREAAQMRKEANDFYLKLEAARKEISQNPMAMFTALGIPEEQVLQFAQQKTIDRLAETIDPQTGQPYTPEQQRIIQLQKELANKERNEKIAKEQAEQREFEQQKAVMRQEIDRTFTAALQDTGLPATPYTMMRLANIMQEAGPDISPAQLAPLVLEDMVNEVRQTMYSMPMEVVVEFLGDEFMGALRKYDIEKARAGKQKFGRAPQRFPGNGERRQATQRRGSDMSTSEAQEYLDKWADGKA